jgi:hypothetical protein
MADLFEKKGPTSYGKFSAPDVGLSSLSTINNGDPFSVHFVHSCKTSKDLVLYLTACQMKRFGKVVDLPIPALQRHVKSLMNTYSADIIARGIKHAANVTERPFSFKFVSQRAIPEVLKRCPIYSMASPTSSVQSSAKNDERK